MSEQARFNLRFRTDIERPFNLTIRYPNSTVDGETVRTVMDKIVELDIFANAVNSLSRAFGASITDSSYTELNITELIED